MTETEKPTTPQGFKTFIGNLAYATTEDGLKQTFSTYGKVLNSVIIKRRGRSLGYGFVDFETKEQAEKAVASLNGSELDSRKINVELAKPREQSTQQQQQQKPRAPRTQNKRRPARKTESGDETKNEVKSTEETKQNEDGFVEKVGRRRQKQQRQQQAASKQQQQQQSKPAATTSQAPRQRKPVQSTNSAPVASTSAAPQTARKRTIRKKRTPRPAGDVPTEAGLFVANIPYNLDEEQFKKIFEEKGFTVVKHRVVKLPNGKSLGYGFVDLKDGEEQKKAVEALNNTQVGGREISVKVAMVKPETEAAPKSE